MICSRLARCLKCVKKTHLPCNKNNGPQLTLSDLFDKKIGLVTL